MNSTHSRAVNARHLTALLALLLVAGCGTAAAPSPSAHVAASHELATEAPEASASEDPLAVCEGVEPVGQPLEIEVGTLSYSFDPRMIEGPTHCQPFVIVFTNSDPPVGNDPGGTNEHNITIRFENLIGPLMFDGELARQGTIRYEVPGLPAGEHYMYCKVHAGMTGRVLVAEA